MRVLTLEGENVTVRWMYNVVDVIRNEKLIGTTTETTCFIEKDGETLLSSSIKKWHKDEFDKEIARKLSLKKVLEEEAYPYKKPEIIVVNGEEFEVRSGDTEEFVSTMKLGRKVFWDAYRNRNVKTVKPKVESLV